MKIKTAELTGAALDWAVAKCEPREVQSIGGQLFVTEGDGWTKFNPSTSWKDGGPIIERERISISSNAKGSFHACYECFDEFVGDLCRYKQWADTPLIAAMRCHCCAILGDEIEIPQELQPCQQPNL